MEYEVRYYFKKSRYEDIVSRLKNIKDLNMNDRCYEKTLQYDHPDQKDSFYSKEIDARFRIRITKNDKETKCKISFKKRLNDTIKKDVNKEEEKEVNFDYNDYDNLIYIIEDVIKMKLIESYERYRTTFTNDDVEISLDEYPFGLALEIESKRDSDIDSNNIIKYWVNVLGLDIKDAYRLSWDDKYTSLCKEQNIKFYKNVTFDKQMPEIKDDLWK